MAFEGAAGIRIYLGVRFASDECRLFLHAIECPVSHTKPVTTESNSILSNVPSNLAAGQKLAGCYLLERSLEAGGGHSIWLAQDEVLGKKVSLHFLPAAVTKDAAALESLRHEVKRGRPLIHPGVLRVYDLVEGDDWTAVAMDAFEGRCLAAILEEKGRFEVDELEAWLDQVCVTLEEAQRIKLTHRDLAPDNIFVTPAGRLLLANFGLSRVVQDSLAKAGASEARIHTLSPQLLAGEAPAPTDDVYGIGTLFHELIAGQPVFSGGDVAEKIRHEIPPRLSEVRDAARDPGASIPPGWENVIAACLNKEPDERPQRPSEIVSGIEAYAPVSAPVVLAPAAAAAVSEEALTEVESAPLRLAPAAPVEEEPLVVLDSEISEETVEMPAELVQPPSEPIEVDAEVEAAVVQTPDAPVPEEAVLLNEAVTSSPPPEAEVVESKAEPLPEKPVESKPKPAPAPHRPVQMYDTEEDAFSSILPKRFRFPVGVAAAVVLLLLLLNGFFKGSKETPSQPPTIATTDSADRTELTSVNNSTPGTSEAPVNTTPRTTDAPDAPTVPEPAATRKVPAQDEVLVAAASAAKAATPSPASPAPSASNLPPDKEIAAKTAAVQRLKEEIAAGEKAVQARAKEQQAAAAALAATQKTFDEKAKAAQAAKKVADELLAARKKREDEQKEAEAAARAAQQAAAEKVRAAEDAKKALADFEAQNRETLAAQDRVDAELKTLQETLAGQQKAAEENARTAAAADAARQQQMAALQQTEQELEQAKANISKASIEEERRRQAALAERQKLDDEIASMRALFEQKMKDIEDRRRQIDSSVKPGATPAPIAPAPAPVPPVPQPTNARTLPTATPAPALPLMAMKTATPAPSVPAPIPAPIPVPEPAAPAPVPPSPGSNSLGMKFVPVGDVNFSVWQTRVKDFEAFAKSVNLKSTAWRGPGFRQGPDHPVVNVTWTEAIAFCKWLTDKERKEGTLPANQFYRLPYDLEWSKGVALPDETGKTPEARDMGVPDVYPWGTDWPPPKGAGNYTGEETGSDVAIKGYDDGFAWTSPVGSFPPNKLGLYDMGGNVWQWCMDSWNNESKAKVLRGASWYNGALKLSLLSSCRIHAAADSSTDNYGFRIVRATETPAGKASRK